MSYFIFDGVLECGQPFELKGEEARHVLKSRRMRSGEHFLIQDQNGQRFDAVLKSSSRDLLSFVPENSVAVPQASALRLEILQALPKEKALDWILQKTTELGVSRLDFFCGNHSPNSFHFSQQKRQLIRWQRIALEASKQCERQHPPEIFCHESLEAALEILPECANSWILSPDCEESVCWNNLDTAQQQRFQRVLIGPEGGLHPDEFKLALRSGMRPVELGPRILRAETAAVSAASILQFLWGDLSGTT
ncbi:MAG: RsmE family RNA methyltransferase [SAR324 cluster bacterium]|nr:RsmE family RNA methyltransferase [SAR324 cluster bacterium]